MDEYLKANQDLWNEWTDENEKSPFYDVAGFKAGKERLKSIELEELGDVRGKKLLHLHWLRDLNRWAQVIDHFLKPGGFFYIVEDHPFMGVFSSDPEQGIKVDNPYFFSEEPYRAETAGSYATNFEGEMRTYYMWDHSLREVLTSLIEAGLRVEFLHEFPFALRAKFPSMVKGEDGYWRFTREHNMVPLLFSLKARKPEGI